MKKSVILLTLCSFFMVLGSVGNANELGTSSINLIKKVSPTETGLKELFAQEFNMLAFALGMYKLDTEQRLSKEAIIEKLTERAAACDSNLDLSFDLQNIDFGKKGFTRYYPFSVNGKDYIIRIFDKEEKHHLPVFEVFYEGNFPESGVGFQVIPGLKALLQDKKVERLQLFNPAAFSNQP